MKIAILSTIYPASILPDDQVQKYNLSHRYDHTNVHNLVEMLAKQGDNDIHVISICNEFKSSFSFKKNGVTYDFVKPASKVARAFTHFESDYWSIRRFLRGGRFDIVHGQGLPGPGYFAARSGCPNVVSIHLYQYRHSIWDVVSFYLSEKKNLNNFYFGLLWTRQELATLAYAKNFICSSPFVRQYLDRIKKVVRLFDVENAISPLFFEPMPEEDEGFALFVGSIDERKSVLELVEALTMVDGMNLQIVSGTSKGDYYRMVREYVCHHGLESRVEFIGPIRNDQVVQIMRKCSFLVLPSKKEGAPLVVGEAMALSKPIIATSVDGIPYMIDHGSTGFLIPAVDKTQLAEKMELLWSDVALRREMGLRARKEALRRWHPDHIAQKTLEVYRTIVDVG